MPQRFGCLLTLALFFSLGNCIEAFSLDARTYRCAVNGDVNLQDDGSLRSDGISKSHSRNSYNGMIIDALTGAITWPGGRREIWKIIQKGGDTNDFVFTPPRMGAYTAEEFATNAATDFIRLRAWKELPRPLFLAFELSSLVSGSCEVIR